MDVSSAEILGKDPKTVNGCMLETRKQEKLKFNEFAVIKNDNLNGRVQVYCALFNSFGSFIMSNMDVKGTGTVLCGPSVP